MIERFQELYFEYGDHLIPLLASIGILIVGVLLSIFASSIARWLMARLKFDKAMAILVPPEKGDEPIHVEEPLSKAVFLVGLLVTGIAILERLNLEFANITLRETLAPLVDKGAKALFALFIMVVGVVVARFLKATVRKVLKSTNIDRQIREGSSDKQVGFSLSGPIAEITYWITVIIFLTQALATLEMDEISQQITGTIALVVQFLPNVFIAIVIMWAGWYAARLAKAIMSESLEGFGLDAFAEKVGLAKVLGGTRLSKIGGWLVYLITMILITLTALEAVKIETITQPLLVILNKVFNLFLDLLAGGVVVGITWVVASFVAGLTRTSLENSGFNQLMDRIGLWRQADKGQESAAGLTGKIVFLAVLLLGSIETLKLFKLEGLSSLLTLFVQFAGRAVLGLAILGAGFFIAYWAEKVILASKSHQKEFMGSAAKFAIWVLSGIMALDQMGMANTAVNIAFGILLGGVALAAALSFGLGGQAMARELLKKWTNEMEKSRKKK